MNYAQYLEKGKTIESTESLIEKVINSQGQDENALQELVNRAQSQDSKAIEFLQMLQQQSGVSKFEKPSGPIVKQDQQDPNMPVAAETGTVDGRKYTYMPYQGEGRGPIDRFEYIGKDGNTYGMTIQGPDTTYVMNGQQYNDPEGQRVIKERRTAVVREKCGGSVKKKETGDKITRKKVMAKGGCPCMIKKVGGRLIEVDSCTGLPIHRKGGNILYAKPGDKIPENNTSRTAKAYMGAKQYDFNFVNPFSSWQEFQRQFGYPVEWAWNGIKKIGEKLDNSEFGKWAMKDYPRPATIVKKPSTAPKTEQEMNQLIQESQAGVRALQSTSQLPGKGLPAVEETQKVESSDAKPETDRVDEQSYTPLFTDDLRSYGARKQWVADNAEYLKSQGWDDARIAGYKGSAVDNIALQKAISGKSAWVAEQEAARQADQQRQQKFVEEMALSRPLEKAAIIPPKTPAIVKPQGLQPTAEQIKSNTLTAVLGQNTSDRKLAKYGKAYDFIKTGANAANMSVADTRRANRLATKMHRAGLMQNGDQLNYANYLN